MSKLTKQNTLTGRPLRAGHPLFDAEKKEALAKAKDDITRFRKTSAESLWREGRAFSMVRDRKLYIQDGYAGMGPWVTEDLKRDLSWVRELMDFADTFTLKQVTTYGREKLDLGIAYMHLTLADESEWKIEILSVEVPTPDGITTKAFPQTTVPELTAAIDHQKKLAARREGKGTTGEQEMVTEKLLEMVLKQLAPTSHAGLGKIELKPSKDGDPANAMLKLEVPYTEFARILKRLVASMS